MQERWNTIGVNHQQRIQQNPERYIVRGWPKPGRDGMKQAIERLNVPGLQVLDLGCGIGQIACWMAKQGATVKGIDAGPDLIEAAKTLARLNQVEVDFRVGDATALEDADGTFDLVLGMAILHHLPVELLPGTMAEVHRVLRPGGLAIFLEPIEDSAIFDTIQNLVPVDQRPSILNRKAWRAYVESQDDRAMSSAELRALGAQFAATELQHAGLTARIGRLFGNPFHPRLRQLDTWLLAKVPPLRRYAQMATAIYHKA